MKLKFILYSLILVFMILITKKLIQYLYYFEEVIFHTESNDNKNQRENRSINKKNILLINSNHKACGGGEVYTISLYENLLNQGHNVKILIVKNSKLEQRLQKQKLSYFAYKKIEIFKSSIQPGLSSAIFKICKEHNIQIVHCNLHRETLYLAKARELLPVKVVLTRHLSDPIKTKYLKNLDGIIAVNSQIKNYLKEEIKKKNLPIKTLKRIPPFFDEQKFISFKPTENKKEFFKKNFDIEIKDLPIISEVAWINDNKNQLLLLKAAAELIHKKKQPVQIVLAGSGEIQKLKLLAKKLEIAEYVFTLGFTNKIPEILFHSDLKILPSKQEAFGIALLEAALMKKPLIGSSNTGMVDIIKHHKTGLLFKNNDLNSLIEQIESLIDHPDLQNTLGENAYEFVVQNFSTKQSLEKIERFYTNVLTEQETSSTEISSTHSLRFLVATT